MTAYNHAQMSGFIMSHTFTAGRLKTSGMPVLLFQVMAGKVPHTIWVDDIKLAVNMYAWFLSMQKLGTETVDVSVSSNVVSSGLISALVADRVTFTPSDPRLRPEVDKCYGELLAGRSLHQWPDTVIEMPERSLDDGCTDAVEVDGS